MAFLDNVPACFITAVSSGYNGKFEYSPAVLLSIRLRLKSGKFFILDYLYENKKIVLFLPAVLLKLNFS